MKHKNVYKNVCRSNYKNIYWNDYKRIICENIELYVRQHAGLCMDYVWVTYKIYSYENLFIRFHSCIRFYKTKRYDKI
jgi:hypothetical protein